MIVFPRAFVYLSQNNYAEAHTSFIEVLKIDPKNPVVSASTFTAINMYFTLYQLYVASQELKNDQTSLQNVM